MNQNCKCYVDYISFAFSDICTRSVAEAQLVQNREIKTEGLSILPPLDINMPASWLVKSLLKYDLVEGCFTLYCAFNSGLPRLWQVQEHLIVQNRWKKLLFQPGNNSSQCYFGVTFKWSPIQLLHNVPLILSG